MFMSRHTKGEHIDPSELIADWKDDEPEDADDLIQVPVAVPLRSAASVAQIKWPQTCWLSTHACLRSR